LRGRDEPPRRALPIDNPRAYLVRVAVREALAAQQAIRRRRETYLGPWLPEPLIEPLGGAEAAPDAAETAIRNESLSMALLVVLETLTPLERAVFVLGEVFGYRSPEIARILDRTPAAVRQLAHRAREHVQARRPRFRADPQIRREITEQFLAALLGGDLEAFMRLLAPEMTIWTDGGGQARATGLRGLQPRERVAQMLAVGGYRPHPGLGFRHRLVNGDPGVVLLSQGAPVRGDRARFQSAHRRGNGRRRRDWRLRSDQSGQTHQRPLTSWRKPDEPAAEDRPDGCRRRGPDPGADHDPRLTHHRADTGCADPSAVAPVCRVPDLQPAPALGGEAA
jgi:RNA polymerase sigma-70 factor (ECF subfamily)